MSQKVNKTLHYRRTVFSSQNVKPSKLETYVGMAFKNLTTVQERTVDVYGRQFQGSAYATKDNVGCFLHIATYREGEQASTVPTGQNVAEVDLGSTGAPQGWEFSDGDVHALIAGDSVFICATGLRDAALKKYLDAIFAKQDMDVPYYEIKPAASSEALKMIAGGVKEIGLNAAADRAEADYMQQAQQKPSMGRSFAHILSALTGNDEKLSQSLKRSDMNIGLRINTKGKLQEYDERLDLLGKVGQHIIEDDEEENFYIITAKGTRITSRDISIQQKYRMDKNAKSVFRDQAWKSLELMLYQLREEGIVDD